MCEADDREQKLGELPLGCNCCSLSHQRSELLRLVHPSHECGNSCLDLLLCCMREIAQRQEPGSQQK